MLQCTGYAASKASAKLAPFSFEREEPGDHDVLIDIMFCGVCHSDIHQVRNEWKNTVYPCLPGHEIVGRVAAVGQAVGRHGVGDLVGVGCMIDSCRECAACRLGEENYCEGPNSWLATYNGPMIPAKKAPTAGNMYARDNTFGGYASNIVVHEDFVLKIPEGLDPAAAAPILCAGVTTYSPLRHWQVKAGDKIGVIGLGGLGNMAVRLAKAMGAEVTVFTSHKDKFEAAKALGADEVLLESDAKAMKPLAASFDFILSTIPTIHDVDPYFPLLKRDKAIIAVGALEMMAPINNQNLAFHRQTFGGSLIGSVRETQEVLDFCATHRVAPEIQVIGIEEVNEAYGKVMAGEVRFRYVIDMKTLGAKA